MTVRGIQSRMVGYTETVYGAAPGTPSGIVIPFVSSNVRGVRARVADPTLTGFRGQVRRQLDTVDVSGQMQVMAAGDSIGFLLKHAIGAPTTTLAGPYQHAFTPALSGANALPVGAHFEHDLGAAMTAAQRYIRYKGVKVASMQITQNAQGLAACTFDLRGQDFSAESAVLDATPDITTHNAFSVRHASIALSSGGAIAVLPTEFQITLNNTLDDSLFTIGGGGIRGALPEGFAEITGSITVLLNNANFLNLILADNDASLIYTLSKGTGDGSAGNEELVFSIGDLTFDSSTPPVEGPQGIRLQATFSAHRMAGEVDFTATLMNNQATIP